MQNRRSRSLHAAVAQKTREGGRGHTNAINHRSEIEAAIKRNTILTHSSEELDWAFCSKGFWRVISTAPSQMRPITGELMESNFGMRGNIPIVTMIVHQNSGIKTGIKIGSKK